ASWVDRPGRVPGRELWFPVLDLVPSSGMQGVAEFDVVPAGARYVINGMFNDAVRPLEKRLTIPATELLHWENLLWVQGGEASLTRFYMIERVPVKEGRAVFKLQPLVGDWRGRIAW